MVAWNINPMSSVIPYRVVNFKESSDQLPTIVSLMEDSSSHQNQHGKSNKVEAVNETEETIHASA